MIDSGSHTSSDRSIAIFWGSAEGWKGLWNLPFPSLRCGHTCCVLPREPLQDWDTRFSSWWDVGGCWLPIPLQVLLSAKESYFARDHAPSSEAVILGLVDKAQKPWPLVSSGNNFERANNRGSERWAYWSGYYIKPKINQISPRGWHDYWNTTKF